MRELPVNHNRLVVIVLLSFAVGVVQCWVSYYLFDLDSLKSGMFILVISMFAIITGWPLFSFSFMSPKTKVRWHGMMQGLAVMFGGMAGLSAQGDGERWRDAFVVAFFVVAIMALVPNVYQRFKKNVPTRRLSP